MNLAATIKGLFAIVGAYIGYMFGGWSTSLYALVAFVSFDYVTGIIASASEGRLDPRIGYIGVAKKLFIFIMVSIAHYADIILVQHIIMEAVTFYYIGTEFLSITKNFGRLGVQVPDILTKSIANFPNKNLPGGGGPSGS